jgi:phosphoenolpyruvate-protein phosphotransferase (PTS system enzyme I)
VIEPSGPVLAGFREVQEEDRREEARLQLMQPLPAVTADGAAIVLRANVEFPDEAAGALAQGAQGIGLFRSEYLLGRSREWPGEERQAEVYGRLLEQMRPHPVTVRTWDVSAEDVTPGGPSSPNPALGERAFRLVPRAPEAFRAQLRALLRASVQGRLRILFPFVSGAADLRLALDLLAEARGALQRAGVPLAERVEVGINIEVPSAALTADLLAPQVDFLSIGTNDLVQYLLAADRADPRVSEHYQPLHPAVLRVIRQVVLAGAPRRMPVSVCGEMAADPLLALALLGLGVRELSMSPGAIPRVKEAIRAASAAALEAALGRCLALPTAAAVEAELRSALGPSHEPEAAASGRLVPEKE